MAALLLLVPAACRRDDAQTNRTSASGEGVIRGQVTYSGMPDLKIIPGSPQVVDETIVTGAHSGLKNVIVYLKDAPKATFTMQTPAVLDQVKCVYVPHVLAVQTGQKLTLKSSDSVMHNVHLKSAVNPDTNYGFQTAGEKQITLSSAEAPFAVRCDVHPWMGAWIGVFDHPWFAVTADDGSFTIEHVPPGNYTLAAWQEALPEQEQKISVSGSGATEANFKFQAP
jgi:plastocyanin